MLNHYLMGTIGTRDYTAYCAINDAFAFRESSELGGHEAIMTYIRSLARRGGELLAHMWHTFTLVPPSMQPGKTFTSSQANEDC